MGEILRIEEGRCHIAAFYSQHFESELSPNLDECVREDFTTNTVSPQCNTKTAAKYASQAS